MNYKKIYNQLVSKRKSSPVKKPYYFERHHIIPKCLGGKNNKDNIVNLTAREHFIAHKLLCKINPKSLKLSFALLCMSSDKSKSAVGAKVSSREYQRIKASYSKLCSVFHPMKGKKLSEERRQQISKSSPRLSGEDHAMFGMNHSEETKQRMRDSSPRLSGEKHSMYGRVHTEESKQKMRESSKSGLKKRWNYDHKKYRFKNINTGFVFFGTRFEFCEYSGISTSYGNLSRLIKGDAKTCKGWCLLCH